MDVDRECRNRRLRWGLFDIVNGTETPEAVRRSRVKRIAWIGLAVVGLVAFGAASLVSSMVGGIGAVITYVVAVIFYAACAIVVCAVLRR